MTGHAGRQVPGPFSETTGMNPSRHLCGLHGVTRRTDRVGIDRDLLNLMTAMAGDATAAWLAAFQLGMSTVRNPLMGPTVARMTADRRRRVGVRSFRDVTMAPDTGERAVCRLSQIGRLDEQRTGLSPFVLFFQIGIVVAGQTHLGRGRRPRDGCHGVRGCDETQPDSEKGPDHLSAVYAPGDYVRYGAATHVPNQDARQSRSGSGSPFNRLPNPTQLLCLGAYLHSTMTLRRRRRGMPGPYDTSGSCPSPSSRIQPCRCDRCHTLCLHRRPSSSGPERFRSWS